MGVKFKTILPRTPMIVENLGEHTKVPKRFSLPYQGSCQAERPFLTISYLVTLAISRLAMTTTLLLVVGILRILQFIPLLLIPYHLLKKYTPTPSQSQLHHHLNPTLLQKSLPCTSIGKNNKQFIDDGR